jgi:hypothetical protein
MSQPGWTRPADITAQLRRRWERGLLLSESLEENPADYPLRLRCRKPTSKDLAEDFNRVRDWIAELEAGSRKARGYGYHIEWRTIRHRVHGSNDLPAAIEIPSLDDAVRLIGKQRELASFRQLTADWTADYPELADWLKTNPLRALEHRDDWPRLRAVLDYFRARPRPALYLRQLEIAGVDSKFIETHRGLISEWLDRVLPDTAIDPSATGVRAFNRRYGLRDKPALVRFRILDPDLFIAGLNDVSVPAEQFAGLSLNAETVFITENEINGLAFPDLPGAIVIFGLGYGLDRLARISWLESKQIIYWGDIDTHGFAILNRLRHHLPQAKSLLMDRDTLEQHRALWGQEPKQRRFLGQLDRLRPEEQALYEDLRDDLLGERVRLEQERIDFGWLRQSLSSAPHPPSATR